MKRKKEKNNRVEINKIENKHRLHTQEPNVISLKSLMQLT